MNHDGTSHDGRLHDLAKRLGAPAAENLDVQATARRVVERLREQPGRAAWIHETWVRIAATLVILVGGALALRQVWSTGGGDSTDHVAHFVADDLGGLSTDQLRNVLRTLDEIVSGEGVGSDSTTDLHELDTEQLRAILREG